MTNRNERGATIVEFALALPLLLTLLIGIIEGGWVFARNVDLSHATREGVRLAAVNFPEYDDPSSPGVRTDANRDALVDEICSRVNLSNNATVTVNSDGERGDPVTVTITTDVDSLTNFLGWIIPDDLELDSTSASRVEQPATWTNATDVACP